MSLNVCIEDTSTSLATAYSGKEISDSERGQVGSRMSSSVFCFKEQLAPVAFLNFALKGSRLVVDSVRRSVLRGGKSEISEFSNSVRAQV